MSKGAIRMMFSSSYPGQVDWVRAFPDQKCMRLGAVLLFASAILSGCGGSSNPLQYKGLHPGTSLQEFEANCPDAKKGDAEKNNDGNAFEVYRLIRPAD